jgi:hypothetical protein
LPDAAHRGLKTCGALGTLPTTTISTVRPSVWRARRPQVSCTPGTVRSLTDRVSSDGYRPDNPAARRGRQRLPAADRRRYGDRDTRQRSGTEDTAAPGHAPEWRPRRTDELRGDRDARRWRKLRGLRAPRRLDGFMVRRVRQLVEFLAFRRRGGHPVAHVGTLRINSRRLLLVPLSHSVRAGGGGSADDTEPSGYSECSTAPVAGHDVERTARPKERSEYPVLQNGEVPRARCLIAAAASGEFRSRILNWLRPCPLVALG